MHRRTRRDEGDDVLSVDAARDSVPSAAARARLSEALRDRAEAYRTDATVDLTIVEALLKLDEPEAAARTLDDHRASLQAMVRDLQVAVADAAVEREAERVWEACASSMDAPTSGGMGGLRRRALTFAGAAAVVLALVLPAGRLSPRTILASMEQRAAADDAAAARERLEAAKTWARALRAQQAADWQSNAEYAARSAAHADVVRTKVRAILAADETGGSADRNTSVASVTDLDAYRARRAAGGSGGTSSGSGGAATAAEPTPPADSPSPSPLDEVNKQVPTVDAPQGVDVPDDTSESGLDSTGALNTAPALPDDVTDALP